MKEIFEAIAWLFEEVLFLPHNALRDTELENWWVANGVNFFFALVGFVAMVYWIKQLRMYDQKGEENKDPSAHSFL